MDEENPSDPNWDKYCAEQSHLERNFFYMNKFIWNLKPSEGGTKLKKERPFGEKNGMDLKNKNILKEIERKQIKQ